MGNVERASITRSISIASRLIVVVGAVYIVFGLFELVNYFYQRPVNLFRMLFYVSIGVGLFEKHAWSRTLCIIASGLTVLSGIYLFIRGGEILWNGSTVLGGNWYVLSVIVVHSFLLCVLLRSDVKNQFSEKENK